MWYLGGVNIFQVQYVDFRYDGNEANLPSLTK